MVGIACSKPAGESSVLQASDLQSDGTAFDPDEIVASGPLQDQSALDSPGVLAFLQHTPYGQASFLATYESHGISAADTIVTAARRYALDPLVFLVRAQMDQGLVGSSSYPSPASRAEYAFGCGCAAPGNCDPAYAGFDVQVGCLGAALRESLDAVASTGKTDGGWGPGVAGTTLDGVQVTPKDDSTAALYQYTPVVAQAQAGGTWLLWNLWRKYAAAISYGGDAGSSPTWIGDPCKSSESCVLGATAGTCATQFPGGLCTVACTASCPSASGRALTFCASFGSQGGFCLEECNPADPQCRAGYTCQSVQPAGGTGGPRSVCFP